MKQCPNCGEDFSSNYCPHCGQKELLEKITLKSIFHETLQVVLLLESPVLHTIKELSLRPGVFVRSYLEGKRKPYLPPVQFFLLAITVYLLFFNFIGEQYFTFLTHSKNVMELENMGRIGLKVQAMLDDVRRNLSIFYFLQPPIFALMFRLFFSGSSFSYAEHLAFSFYLVGAVTLLSTLIALVALFNIKLLLLRIVFLFCFYPFAIVQFYRGRGVSAYLVSLVAVVLTFFTYGLCVSFMTLIYHLAR